MKFEEYYESVAFLPKTAANLWQKHVYLKQSDPTISMPQRLIKLYKETNPLCQSIVRMQHIPPRVGELYYLQMFLERQPATSFENLYELDGRRYESCQDVSKEMMGKQIRF